MPQYLTTPDKVKYHAIQPDEMKKATQQHMTPTPPFEYEIDHNSIPTLRQRFSERTEAGWTLHTFTTYFEPEHGAHAVALWQRPLPPEPGVDDVDGVDTEAITVFLNREMADLLYLAWTIIANVSEGDWTQQTGEWATAARRWRDRWHDVLPLQAPPPETPLPETPEPTEPTEPTEPNTVHITGPVTYEVNTLPDGPPGADELEAMYAPSPYARALNNALAEFHEYIDATNNAGEPVAPSAEALERAMSFVLYPRAPRRVPLHDMNQDLVGVARHLIGEYGAQGLHDAIDAIVEAGRA